ncbi:MAG: cytochrome oxidase assembly protein, partial [Microbacterium sp.]
MSHAPATAASRPSAVQALLPDRITRYTRVLAWLVLVTNIVIVGTGGLVRLTGSGLGCSTFPECEPGQLTSTLTPATGLHGFVEFGNRLLTFVVLDAAVAAAVAVWRIRPRRQGLRLLAAVPLLGVLAQALLGGASVLLDLHPV